MDYLQFKKRIVLTRSYNFIFLEANATISDSIQIGIIKINSMPFVVAVGNENQLAAIISMLKSSKLETNINEQININNQCIIKNSKNLESNINSVFSSEALLNVDGVQLVNIDSIHTFLNILATVYTPPPVRPMTIDLDLTLPLVAKGGVGSSIYTRASIIDISSIGAEIKSTTPIAIESTITHLVSLSIVLAKGNPILVGASPTASVNIITLLESCASNVTFVQTSVQASINSNLGLCRKAALSDYTNNALSSLNNKTIKKLSYTDIS